MLITNIQTEVAKLDGIMKAHFTYKERKLIRKILAPSRNMYAGDQKFPGAKYSSSVVFERERGNMKEKTISDLASKINQNPETAKRFIVEQSRNFIRFCFNAVESELMKLHCDAYEEWINFKE